MNIFLIGFMGSGKSSFGKKLASKLNKPFIDLDERIESHARMSIPEIFKEKGEEGFRNLESECLKNQHGGMNAVVALGGGTPCSEENWKFISEQGLSIYLKTDAEVLLGRLRQNREQRPLISDLSDDALKDFVTNKLPEREKFYQRADMTYEKGKTSLDFLEKQLADYTK